jgi:nucleotide-binding universal stress UspA family protein
MEAVMAGTILCGVTDSPEGRDAAQLADALSARLGLRLVLAHVVDGIPVAAEESLTALHGRKGGERLLRALAHELGHDQEPELRLAHGHRAERLAQFAAEEGADLIVVGSRPQGLRGRKLCCTLARELEAATPVPVLIAPPQTRKRSHWRPAEAPSVLRRAAGVG